MSMKMNGKFKKDADLLADSPKASVGESAAPKKKRKFTRKTLFKIMFVISIIFIMISLTYSWFSLSETAHVNGVNVGVTDPNNLIADDEFLVKGKIDSIAGNGTSFFKPIWHNELVDTQNGFNIYKKGNSGTYNALPDNVVIEDPVADNLFVKDFTLSIKGKHNIYLVEGSGIEPEGTEAKYLEGAMRVAILKFNEETKQYDLCFIWIPDVTSTKTGGSLLDDKVTAVSPDGNGGAKEETFTINGYHGEKTVGGVRYAWGKPDADNSVLVGELEGTAKYRCVIWLDGNDRECNNELLDKDIVATFKFNPEATMTE